MSALLGKYAQANELDPDLVAAVAYVESWFPVDAWPQGFTLCPDGPVTGSCTSYAGAMGPMQVMPFHFQPGEDGRDLETNIAKGCRLLRSYINEMGNVEGGLAAYNAGPTGAREGGGWGYSAKVLQAYNDHK